MFDPELENELSDADFHRLTVEELDAWTVPSEQGRQMIPAGLDEWSPGPFLAAVLSAVDHSKLNGFDLVVVMRAHARQIAPEQANYYASIGEGARCEPTGVDGLPERSDEWFEFAALEVRAALALTRRAADSELGLAHDLTERLPAVWESLHAGLIDARRARTIVHGTSHLPGDTARDVVDRIIDQAPALTTGQLAARIRKLCIEVDPDQAEKKLAQGLEARRIVDEANTDGTANLAGMHLAPHRVAAIRKRLNRLAQHLNRDGDPRTMDQLRADIYLDLLQGREAKAGNGRGTVDISVDLETLTRLSEAPGEIPGWGPVIADIARQVVEEQEGSEWRTTVTDPETGQIIHTGTTRRRPTASQQREVEARYPTCVFPGCRMPASDCDIDHRTPWAEGGPTTTDQLAPLCRYDHRGKHEAGWKLRRLAGGEHVWTSRLGHTYTTSGQPP